VAGHPLRNLDLNLLVTLDALISERNVTRAAGRLGMSQPAVSAALRRLRRHFGDELLARTGNRYELTPLAENLRERTTAALVGVKRVFEAAPEFDPHTSNREFTLIVSDYAATVLGDHLATVMAERAPGARLRLEAQTYTAVDNAPESLRHVDGMVLPHGFLSETPVLDLYSDDWALVASRDNEDIGEVVTLDQIAEMPWVVTHHQPTAFTLAARQLTMIGVEPEIHVVVETFLSVPFLVAGTRRIAVLPRLVAMRLAGAAGVRVLTCPWPVVPLLEAFWWHPSHRSDPAHAWLREALTDAAARVTADARGL
jgi:DNA-binding transcriptional LysR family regulator